MERLADLFCGQLGGIDAVWDANAFVNIACQRQALVFLRGGLDLFHAFKVAQVVLRHGILPAEDAREHGGGLNTHRLGQFDAGQRQNFFVAGGQLFTSAANEDAK